MNLLRMVIKGLLRPMTSRLFSRVDRRIADSEGRLGTSFRTLAEEVRILKTYLPTVLNAISSQNAATRDARRAEVQLSGRLDALEARLEVVEHRGNRGEPDRAPAGGVEVASGPPPVAP